MKLRVKAKNCQFDFTVVLVLKLLENINVWLPFEIQGSSKHLWKICIMKTWMDFRIFMYQNKPIFNFFFHELFEVSLHSVCCLIEDGKECSYLSTSCLKSLSDISFERR